MALLIIDDFGRKVIRLPQDEDLHESIAERYERLHLVSTSNLDFDEWPEAFPDNKLLTAATLDRITHGAYRIVLDGQIYRKPRASTGQKQDPEIAQTAASAKP